MATGVTATRFQLVVPHGEPLSALAWVPAHQPVAAVGVIHGLGEHSGRYRHVAERFAAADLLVLAYDQRGHGQSGGSRGHVGSYQWLLDDLEQLLEELRSRVGKLPVFLYGHSLGGNLVLNLALRRQPTICGVIATSPLLLPTFQPPRWKRGIARLLNPLAPAFAFQTGIQATDLSSDPAAMDVYRSDPLIHDRVSARLAVQMFAAGRWALAHAPQLSTPTLLQHGTKDPLTSCSASCEFARRAPQHCTLRTWPGLLHELHWERQRDEVLGVTLDWLATRVAASRSDPAPS